MTVGTRAQVTAAVGALLVAAACRSPTERACRDLVAHLGCGGLDVAHLADCDTYGDRDCDLSDYFECLDRETTCNGSGYAAVDPEGRCAVPACAVGAGT